MLGKEMFEFEEFRFFLERSRISFYWRSKCVNQVVDQLVKDGASMLEGFLGDSFPLSDCRV